MSIQSITFNPSKVRAETISYQRRNTLENSMIFKSSKQYSELFQCSSNPLGMPTEGLVSLLTDAYNRHYKVVIRPEDVWITIQSQFSIYVNKYSEELRAKFVRHEGIKHLIVTDEECGSRNIGKMSQFMTEKMKEFLNNETLVDWILPNFSTTTDQDKCSFAIIVMGTLKKYFSYEFMTMCGLPEVTLLGSAEDWQKLREKVLVLLDYNMSSNRYMEKWCNLLLPVLDKFVETAAGKPDLLWWNNVAHQYSGGSGSDTLAGWITVFNVFSARGDWLADEFDEKLQNWPALDMADIAPSYSSMQVKMSGEWGNFEAMLYAGMYGANVVDNALVPRIEWAIYKLLDKPTLLQGGWCGTCNNDIDEHNEKIMKRFNEIKSKLPEFNFDIKYENI